VRLQIAMSTGELQQRKREIMTSIGSKSRTVVGGGMATPKPPVGREVQPVRAALDGARSSVARSR